MSVRAFLVVVSCPVKFSDGSFGILRGTDGGWHIRRYATFWQAWVRYILLLALLRAVVDGPVDIVVLDGVKDASSLLTAAEHQYRSRGTEAFSGSEDFRKLLL